MLIRIAGRTGIPAINIFPHMHPVKAATDPTERSILPVRTTPVSPKLKISNMLVYRNIVTKLDKEKKSGLMIDEIITRTSKASKVYKYFLFFIFYTPFLFFANVSITIATNTTIPINAL